MSAEGRRFALGLYAVSVLKQAKVRAITEMLGETRGLRCLDIGGDNGVVSLLLRERGGDWASADLDEGTVTAIRALVGDPVVRCDGTRLPVADASFAARAMTAKQTAKYYWQGNPIPARELRSDMNGPFDDSYIFSDTIGTADLVWSPCGATRRLNAQTRLMVRNNTAKTGSGYTNTTSIDATVHTPYRWTFWLNWRAC